MCGLRGDSGVFRPGKLSDFIVLNSADSVVITVVLPIFEKIGNTRCKIEYFLQVFFSINF